MGLLQRLEADIVIIPMEAIGQTCSIDYAFLTRLLAGALSVLVKNT